MKTRTLFLSGMAALAATPGPAAPDLVVTPWEQEDQGPGVASPTSAALMVTPEDRVAAMVREALRAPDQERNWACLDQALSEMDASAGDGRPWDPRTQRPADTLACALGPSAAASSSGRALLGGPQTLAELRVFLSGAWKRVGHFLQRGNGLARHRPLLLPGILLALGMVLFWVGRRSAGVRNAASGSMPLASRNGETPQSLALALWQGGLPTAEIARRTGLAHDALAVLLAVNGMERAVAPPGPRPPAPRNPYARFEMERK